MRDIQTTIDTLQVKLDQQKFDLAVLALWDHAERCTGKTYPEIKAFTFRPEYLTKEQARENRKLKARGSVPRYCHKNWHNCVRLANGDLLGMEGIARPIPPDWMKTGVKKVDL